MVLLDLLLGFNSSLKGKGDFLEENKVGFSSKVSDFQFLFLKELSNLKSSEISFFNMKESPNLLKKSVSLGLKDLYLGIEEAKGKVEKNKKVDIKFANLLPFSNIKGDVLMEKNKTPFRLGKKKVDKTDKTFDLNSKRNYYRKSKPLFIFNFRRTSIRILSNAKSFYGLKNVVRESQKDKRIDEKVFFKPGKRRKKGQVLSSIKLQSFLVGFPSLGGMVPRKSVIPKVIDSNENLKNNSKTETDLKSKNLGNFNKLSLLKGKDKAYFPVSVKELNKSESDGISYVTKKFQINSSDRLKVEKFDLANQKQNEKVTVPSNHDLDFKIEDDISLLTERKGRKFIESKFPSNGKELINKQNIKDSEKSLNSEILLQQKVKVQLELESKKEKVRSSKLNKGKLEKILIHSNSKLLSNLGSERFSKVEDQVTQSDIASSVMTSNTGNFETVTKLKLQLPEVKLEGVSHYREYGKTVVSLLSPQEQSGHGSSDFRDGFSSSDSFENRKNELPVPKHVNSSFQNLVIRNEDMAMRLSFNRAGILNLSLRLSESYTLEPSLIEDIRSIIRSSGFTPGKVYLKVKSKGEAKERTTELKV
ncbi:hypothetical protein C7457_0109 [Thermovibrio guaymasensis]|uniref:Uncharacterized protein n=1 Tax=Thermovibrio guaymasensis TaxID=240167 RepID=A0A420W7F4_9BACT|nr:hypothetical protein [Thermovibrio guaymasensis]RKQ63246.1 hypothetical protein C7457_0109 [Thermovibrio guaymasensis]